VTQPTDHIDDETLSSLVDHQLTSDEAAQVQTHLATCAVCQAQVDDLGSLASLLRGLPDLDPPRDFALGPHLVTDPPNVVRLQRWYMATRAVAASLAAVFVLLSVGTLYIDSRPATTSSAQVTQPRLLSSPSEADGSNAAAPALSQPAAAPQVSPPPATPLRTAAQPAGAAAPQPNGASAPQPAGAAAPQPAGASAPQPAGAAAPQPNGASAPQPAGAAAPQPAGAAVPQPAGAAAARPATTPQADDQVAAATSIRPLPTLPPTAVPTPPAVSAPTLLQPPASADPAAPVRTSAAIVGLLAVMALLAALVIRHRLQHLTAHL
jgi:hypothetical protein